MIKIAFFIIAFIVTVSSAYADLTAPAAPLKRFAISVGSNIGDNERVQLKYAVRDARVFADVLTNLGGVDTINMLVMGNPDLKQLNAGLKRLEQMVTDADEGRKEVVMYYSGHADSRGILLGSECLTYKELKKYIADIPVDVRIVILDACASGEVTREKGGRERPPFLFDASSAMKGHAYLTSSSFDEGSQESDSLKGSLFTHYLVSGLRGGADADTDGKITLDEAYQHAFDGTLRRTQGTFYGAQHPAYDIRLKGSGDLVMTDLRMSSAGLRLAPAMTGRVFVRDRNGVLLVELNKTVDKTMELGLEPGTYHVTLETFDSVLSADVVLNEKQFTEVQMDGMQRIKSEVFALRGNVLPGVPAAEAGSAEKYRTVALAVSFIPSIFGSRPEPTITKVSLGILASSTDRLNGVDLSSIASNVTEDMRGAQIAGVSNTVSGRVQGMQMAGVINIARMPAMGSQIAGVANYTPEINGVQVAGVSNHVNQVRTGVQIAGVSNSAVRLLGPEDGTQHITQIAGVVNYAGSRERASDGKNDMRDNEANAAVQIAGVVNIAPRVDGVQIGTVNYAARITGVQVGVVNISGENTGVPIGLLNFVKSNPPRVQVWTDESGYLMTGIRTGSRYGYSLLALGARASVSLPGWTLGCGLGFRVPLRRTFLGIETMTMHHNENTAWDNNEMVLVKTRLVSGFRLAHYLTVWGGPSFNMYWSHEKTDQHVAYWKPKEIRRDTHWYGFWPGFAIGVEFKGP
ncbi:MAG: caspase family protein [Chitinispirillaceae bacterium]|nr:caspase family protein [Chitinispirillaceae bacterium]